MRPVLLALIAAVLVAATPTYCYQLSPSLWPNGAGVTRIPVHIALDTLPPKPLLDGSPSWYAVAERALNDWNACMGRLVLEPVRSSLPASLNDGCNSVVFADNAVGIPPTEAITVIVRTENGVRVEVDIVFAAWTRPDGQTRWDSLYGAGQVSGFLNLAEHAARAFGLLVGLEEHHASWTPVGMWMFPASPGLLRIGRRASVMTADEVAGAAAAYGPPPASRAPHILSHTPSLSAFRGGSAELAILAAGAPPLVYEWLRGGALIAQTTTPSLTLTDLQPDAAGTYAIRVVNSAGLTATTVAVPVTVQTQPPTFVSNLSGPGSVHPGGSASFSCSVSGSAPFTYSWYRDDTLVAVTAVGVYSIPAVAATDAGNYAVVVSNAVGSLRSVSVRFQVVERSGPPVIVQQPEGGYMHPGGSISLTVRATSAIPTSYTWYHDGQIVPTSYVGWNPFVPTWSVGWNSPKLTNNGTPNLTAYYPGTYYVRVRNAEGSVQSESILVSERPYVEPLAIREHPQSQLVTPGSTVTFRCAALGGIPITYLWHRDGTPIPTANKATLTIPGVQPSDIGAYTVTLTNPAGSLTSNPAVLEVRSAPAAPKVLRSPSSLTVIAGAPVNLSVEAEGTLPLAYQWSREGVPIATATGATFRISAASPSDSGRYSVTVSNSVGSAISEAANLAVVPLETAPVITGQPADTTVQAGQRVSLRVVASGTHPLSYVWRQQGVVIRSATSDIFELSSAQLSDGGTYDVTVSNRLGSLTSRPASLTVVPAPRPPTISKHPAGATAMVGENLRLSVDASGTAPLGYSWSRSGIPLPGATDAVLALGPLLEADAGEYAVTVTNAAGSVSSLPVTVVVLPRPRPPTFASQPVDTVVEEGQRLTLSASAVGSEPLTYSWFLDGAPLPGESSAAFVRPTAARADAGFYRVEVRNAAGVVVSAPVRVEVRPRLFGRLTNVSLRAPTQPAGGPILGVAIEGSPRRILLRAVGPSLSAFAVPDATEDPMIEVLDFGRVVGANDDWGGQRALSSAFAAVGAFALPQASRDAALILSLDGSRTIIARGPPGQVLLEAYDLEESGPGRLANLSARSHLASERPLIVGFSVFGGSSRRLLLRAVGPSLAAFGVAAPFTDPWLRINAGDVVVAENDNWTEPTAATFAAVGAFALPAGSRDAALVVTLPAGGYTAQVAGPAGARGEILVEVYELPDP